MTTIAYKSGIVAYDSRVCNDLTVGVLEFNKMRVAGGARFFFAGSTADIDDFIARYLSGDYSDCEPLDCVAIVWDHGKLYHSGIDSDGHLWRDPHERQQPFAIGSGSPHALTAMDCGCSAKEAVQKAALRDVRTGGRIRTYKLWA